MGSRNLFLVTVLFFMVWAFIACAMLLQVCLHGGQPDWGVAIWSAVAAGAITAIAWKILINQWINPARDIERTADRLASGEWYARAEPSGQRVLRRLAINLSMVAENALQQLEEVRQQRADLHALVDALPDPILATDGLDRLILMNAPASQLLQISPAQALRQKFVSVVSDEAIVSMFEACEASGAPGKPLHREIRLARGGRRMTYQAVATPTAAGGVLLVLRDISTLASAMQMKTDFVANASHELRTPVAAIKLAFETLREVYGDDPSQIERFLSIIDGHMRRLEGMLADLLDLSLVEGPDFKPQVTSLNTADVLAALKATLGPMARQKSVDLVVENGSSGEFLSDSRLINLIIKNLVENSIKFTPAGGKVTAQISEDPAGQVTLRVIDTGIGIAPQHLDRVFERFYQVDASRSGTAGRGTGLGLAIVKHAVNALGGTVQLQSTVGVGTTVICQLPQPGQPPQSPEPVEAISN